MKEQIFYERAEKHKAREWMISSLKKRFSQVMTRHLMTRYQMGTIILSGTGLVENIQTLGLSQDYKDSSKQISKWLKSRLQGQQ